MRGDEPSPTRSSVLVRLSHSHIRFGSFQRQAYLQRSDNIERLLGYSIAQYFPDLEGLTGEHRAPAFLSRVVDLSAQLAASWMVAGFVHGVLNTDNMNVTGESFDYGPYRFLPTLDPGFTAAYFDHGGLYAYGRQPETVLWNLTRLAECLLPIAKQDELVAALEVFNPRFHSHYLRQTLSRLGVRAAGRGQGADDPDVQLVNAVTTFLHEDEIGFERFFFDWYGGAASAGRALAGAARNHYESAAFSELRRMLEQREAAAPARLGEAYFQQDAPCTLLIEEIESLWQPIADADDWSLFGAKLDQVAHRAAVFE
jgi:uncharacterized protein YdiU (UPF0061 family)